jgi:ABC-type branched-subunit amino acid transport system substrate-binding protein
MKRILLVSLLLIMALAVAACGTTPQVEELAPTLQAAAEQLAPTVQAAVEEIAPTVQAAATELAPTVDAAVEAGAATVAAAATSLAAATEEPTAEPTAEPVEESGEMVTEECTETYDGETITIYQAAGLTGPLAQILGDGFITGSQAAVERINAAGGVCGVQLELRLEDSQYDPEQEVAIYEQYRAEDPPPLIHLTYGSGAAIVLKDRVIEDKIPHITAGLNDEAFYIPRNGYTFGTGPIYSDQFAGFVGWLQDNWDEVKPEGAGDEIVVGVVGWANAFGAGATTAAALEYLEGRGITVLPLESQEVSPTADVTGQLQNLLANGANVIWAQSLSFGPAQVIGTLRALGAWDSVIASGVNWSMNTDVVNILGENAALMEGYYGIVPNYWWNDTDNAGIQMALEDFEAAGLPDAKKDIGYLLSYGQMFGVANILRHAMNTVGFEGLTGEEVFNAMQDMGTIDVGGMATWSAGGEDRSPREAQVRQAQLNDDGAIEFVVIEDFMELPDTRPPAP